ncbi:hypothetical protein EYR40_008876 [Pleurotus pulmonarius]|nr:hypothetical protein EYR36_009698 [Pleurotus pulmonarius]KAF4593181.1 hypothetical protein EYR38_008893 [Pleurotus pulmonarius]KAF4594077.1 hypothetical protein EYR40_008876 [Pleurotus pulmonarius]
MYAQNPRTSASSSSSSSNHSAQWGKQNSPSDVSAAVHRLLLSTKQLQESLRLWSTGQMTETEVSDVYVTVGTDFNNVIRAFAYHRIDLTDIHSIPQDLRAVLEQCLSEDPSPEALATYMPGVRQVLFKLLKGLQTREAAWKAAKGIMMS